MFGITFFNIVCHGFIFLMGEVEVRSEFALDYHSVVLHEVECKSAHEAPSVMVWVHF